MAVVSKFQNSIPSIFPKADSGNGNADQPAEPTHRPHEPEAPDRGASGEAPEGRMPEAPDAGDGRASFIEHEFTHGRSQS